MEEEEEEEEEDERKGLVTLREMIMKIEVQLIDLLQIVVVGRW
jgi:hypothetical protein